jgi:Protein of unknown function (DUF3800)
MTAFSDYIVFADESGSPVIANPDPTFPVFVLCAVLVNKSIYMHDVPAMQALKFAAVGHDQLILHERDIRRQQKDFAFLQTSPERRDSFIQDVNACVGNSDITVVAAVIDKIKLASLYATPWSPYQIALHFCMETLLVRLLKLGQRDCLVHVVFESRGRKEDAELELQFRRIAANRAHWGYRRPDFKRVAWEPMFVDKKSNSAGLQLADLLARPIGLKALRPLQPNRAFDVIEPKLINGGMKCFP